MTKRQISDTRSGIDHPDKMSLIDFHGMAETYADDMKVPVENIEFEFTVTSDYYDSYSSLELNIHGWRWETDLEEAGREARELEFARQSKIEKERREKEELARKEHKDKLEFERLKKKFEGS